MKVVRFSIARFVRRHGGPQNDSFLWTWFFFAFRDNESRARRQLQQQLLRTSLSVLEFESTHQHSVNRIFHMCGIEDEG